MEILLVLIVGLITSIACSKIGANQQARFILMLTVGATAFFMLRWIGGL